MFKVTSILWKFSAKSNLPQNSAINNIRRIVKVADSGIGSSMTSSSVAKDRIVWMDLEMTGLNVRTNQIIEISCLITDNQLNIVAEGPELAINYPKDVLNNIEDEWVRNQHTASGLLEKCLQSQISLQMAEQMVLDFLKQHVPHKSCPLAGNTIYMDRMFIAMNMPLVHDYLHYRLIDVSSIKELAQRWNSPVWKSAPRKSGCHRSLTDIKESIAELKHYRMQFFKLIDEQTDEGHNSGLVNT